MLQYAALQEVIEARKRLKRNYYQYRHSNHTRDSDTMLVFTQGTQAEAEAKNNLAWCLDVGQQHQADLLVIHDNKIQFLGKEIQDGIMERLMPEVWRKQYLEDTESRNIDVSSDSSGHGELYTTHPWRRAFADPSTHGIYDIASSKRIKNRREIISLFWRYGYAAQRGVPLSVARIRHTGTREELEEISALADRYWSQRSKSEVAKKIVSVWRSTARYAAWPGSW